MRGRPRHVAALALSVLLVSPGAGLCEGWAATSAERMACCVNGHCAMHESAQASVTQADADSCCALSQQDQSPSPPTFVPAVPLVPSISPVTVMLAPTVVASGYSPVPIPLPGRQVPRHLLLSVILV